MKSRRFIVLVEKIILVEVILVMILGIGYFFQKGSSRNKKEPAGTGEGQEILVETEMIIEEQGAAGEPVRIETEQGAAGEKEKTKTEQGAAGEPERTETEQGETGETECETVRTETFPDTPAGRAAALGLPEPPDVDITSWEFLLVNSEHTLDENYVPQTGYASSMTSGTEQDARITESLNAFAAAAEAQGLPVYLSSGYRSYGEQKYLFDLKCQQYSYEEAAQIVAIPGTSEHQTGLCCDITDIYRSPKNSELENTQTYQWMSAHCGEYGFIVRYPKNKSEVTGIMYEPWHFRYVGKEAAAYIMENDLTLEEFTGLYCG